MMLELEQLIAGYGNSKVLKNIDLRVPDGSIVSLVGANGAGKTTLMKTIMGLIKPVSGQILFNGQLLQNMPTHQIAGLGLSLVPEGRGILAQMTVLENLELGACRRSDAALRQDLQQVLRRFPILEERRHQLGGTLSGGQQQLLAIGRAMMARPKLLLLDEPSMGLAPLVVADIFRIIQEINRNGTTILLVEQNVRQALKIAQYAYVLETGRVILHGPAADVGDNPRVMEAYLGGRRVS